MELRKTAVEKAFELARSGKCLSIRDVAYGLRAERYDISYLEGPALRKQLQAVIEEALKQNTKCISQSLELHAFCNIVSLTPT